MKFEAIDFAAEDTALVRELIALGVANYTEAFPDKEVNVDWHKLAALVTTKIAYCVVAKSDDGKIVGYQIWEHFGSWVERGRTSASLRAIYMTPETRVGANFVKFVSWGIDYMKASCKPSDIVCMVDVGNVLDSIIPRLGFEKAATMYKKQGWVD